MRPVFFSPICRAQQAESCQIQCEQGKHVRAPCSLEVPIDPSFIDMV